jgi:hypothetical protein
MSFRYWLDQIVPAVPPGRMVRTPLLALLLASGLLLALWTPGAFAHSLDNHLVNGAAALAGLLRDDALCGAYGFRIEGTDLCTHGPDAPYPGMSDADRVSAANLSVTEHPYQVDCNGDGISGKRVQVMYVRTADVADRYAESVDAIRRWATEVDVIVQASARKTGGHRQVRFVMDGNCQINVLSVVLAANATGDFRSHILAMRALGYDDPNRKYLMFVDANVFCGIGSIQADSQPGAANRSNHTAGYARVDRHCWGGATAAHELIHTLGGIQRDAPNSSGGWHCVDEYDIMCYLDSARAPAIQWRCLDRGYERLLDCNHDDYFHTAPPPGSYLATHWNVADSPFLLTRVVTPTRAPPDTLAGALAVSIDHPFRLSLAVTNAQSAILMVEFYSKNTLLETDITAPFGMTWRASMPGRHTLYAKIYTVDGAVGESNQLFLSVSNDQVTSNLDDVELILVPGDLFLPVVLSR